MIVYNELASYVYDGPTVQHCGMAINDNQVATEERNVRNLEDTHVLIIS